ncbi:hypothetical protein L3556_10300 [Candidatus Synechococcus calcipolaris G9]|uniref:Uncharacterized protein n=1 Tax=Candidatus Synechococcus calcipolaris G9 TaxID=1497997 RepID=A0ABT6F0F1_9SYNE|nr:hypothetical protein [Candidatus Synechococcus calcipolaris]MDG2991317.1 hypothetical protein [Candidatus Synechococcus calcipolaris G9]
MSHFPLCPRYRLDADDQWLEGVDPSRHYWLWVNGDRQLSVFIPGVLVTSRSELKEIIQDFRALEPGQSMQVGRIVNPLEIHCIADNCFAIADEIDGAPVWHLFDRETLDSLIMTAHPDWHCRPEDVELGRRHLWRSLTLPVAA